MKNIYTLIGNEKILIDKKINEIKDKYKDYDCADIIIDLEEQSIITLLEELITIPFLEEIKIITVINPEFIYDDKKIESRLIESFVNYLSNPSETTVLIILMEKDSNSFVAKKLKENTTVSAIEKLVIDNLKDYATNSFNEDGYAISKMAIEELVSRVNHDMTRVVIEIEKLKIYKYESKKIEYEDVVKLVNKDLEDNIFSLVDAVLNKNKERIIEIYSELMIMNLDETFIIASLVSKFNEMYQTKSLLESGIKKDEIAQIFNVKPGRAYYMIQNASLSGIKYIKENINKLVDLDYRIKSGKTDKKMGLELYLLSI